MFEISFWCKNLLGCLFVYNMLFLDLCCFYSLKSFQLYCLEPKMIWVEIKYFNYIIGDFNIFANSAHFINSVILSILKQYIKSLIFAVRLCWLFPTQTYFCFMSMMLMKTVLSALSSYPKRLMRYSLTFETIKRLWFFLVVKLKNDLKERAQSFRKLLKIVFKITSLRSNKLAEDLISNDSLAFFALIFIWLGAFKVIDLNDAF